MERDSINRRQGQTDNGTSADVTRGLVNIRIDLYDGGEALETLYEADVEPYPYDEEFPADEEYISDEDPYSGEIVVVKPERQWLSGYEIARNLKIKTHISSEDEEEEEEEEEACAICLVEFKNDDKIGFLQCPHDFHEECITEWLQQKNTCPLCKGKALDTNEESGISWNWEDSGIEWS